MNNNEKKNEHNPGLKKLGIGFEVRHVPYGIEEAKWKVMQSILTTLVLSGAIRIDVRESDGETVVFGYMFVENSLSDAPTDKYNRIDHKVIKEAVKKYPFLESLLKANYTPQNNMSNEQN